MHPNPSSRGGSAQTQVRRDDVWQRNRLWRLVGWGGGLVDANRCKRTCITQLGHDRGHLSTTMLWHYNAITVPTFYLR